MLPQMYLIESANIEEKTHEKWMCWHLGIHPGPLSLFLPKVWELSRGDGAHNSNHPGGFAGRVILKINCYEQKLCFSEIYIWKECASCLIRNWISLIISKST